MTQICVSDLTKIGSDNAGILLIRQFGTNFTEILFEILLFSFTKMCLRVSSVKRRPFRLGLNVLTHCGLVTPYGVRHLGQHRTLGMTCHLLSTGLLPKLMLTSYLLNHLEQTSVEFELKEKAILQTKYIWNCRLLNAGHFCNHHNLCHTSQVVTLNISCIWNVLLFFCFCFYLCDIRHICLVYRRIYAWYFICAYVWNEHATLHSFYL